MDTTSAVSIILRAVAVTLALFTLGGCKLAVINVEGGEVQSIASGTCLAGTVCLHQVTDTNYSESFTAVPDEGWRFVRWNAGDNFHCKDSTNSTCVASNVGLGGPVIDAAIATDAVIYIMPVFEYVGIPSSETIVANGRIWAQPDLFKLPWDADDLAWDTIHAVCPGGICAGMLNGYDMTGWTWASVADLHALFNYYIGAEVLGPDTPSYEEDDSEWLPAFFNDGWRPTNGFEGYYPPDWTPSLEGRLYEKQPGGTASGPHGTEVPIDSCTAQIGNMGGNHLATGILQGVSCDWDFLGFGAWFYRPL